MSTRFNHWVTLAVLGGVLASAVPGSAETLKVYLLAGQSNMEGEAYAWNNPWTTTSWQVPTVENLTNNSAYFQSLPDAVYSFKSGFNDSWLDTPRSDVWAINVRSANGQAQQVRSVNDTTPGDNNTPAYPTGIQPLSVGFGRNGSIGGAADSLRPSMIGPELGLGHRLGEALDAPVFLYKSATGGTDLAFDWRSTEAVQGRGGSVGAHYTNTINGFKSFLDGLDADLADDGVLNGYNGATAYEIAGFVWLQGWNEASGSQANYTTAQKLAEYKDNLVDLVNSVRSADARIPDNLPAVIVESSDQNASLNASRQAAVDALNAVYPNSAVYVETNGMVNFNYGGLNPATDAPFANSWGYHYHARAENVLQLGWLMGDAILENGFVGVPEPSSAAIIGIGICVVWGRRRRSGRLAMR